VAEEPGGECGSGGVKMLKNKVERSEE